jgi:hypothetical protein
MKSDIDKKVEQFIKDLDLGIGDAFRLRTLITEVKLESYKEGMDKGEEIQKHIMS